MQMSEQINEIAAALAKAQGAFSNPDRNREVEVTLKSGGKYKFKYATLDAIMSMVRKPLADNGLSFIQALDSDNGTLSLSTSLMHSSGQWLQTTLPVRVEGGGAQALGSAITYAKRYAITAMLGVAADEDDDGNAAEGNSVVDKSQRAARSAKPAPKQDEPEWKATAERIKHAIDAAETVPQVNGILQVQSKALEEIKGHSATAYEFLIDRANKRSGMLVQEPPAEAAE